MAGRIGRKKYMKDEDFEEEEVWGVMEERPSSSSTSFIKPMMMIKDYSSLSPHSPVSSCPRMIPRSSSSSSSSSILEASNKQFSAPLDIPDWSKIYGKSSKKNRGMNSSTSWVDVIHDDHNYDGYNDGEEEEDDDDDGHVNDDDDDDDDDGVVPPHEYIARKQARSQISSFSVCEGIGRTLKGRDLRKVRNAILTRTGFLE